jgi:hypothetical protein
LQISRPKGRPVPGQAIVLAILLGCAQASATTFVSPTSPTSCDLIIHELLATKNLSQAELLSKMRETYKLAMNDQLTIADLEGLRDAPLTFNNWSNPLYGSTIQKILDHIRENNLPSLSEANQATFLNEILPTLIQSKIEQYSKADEDWQEKRNTLIETPIKTILKTFNLN